MTMVCTLGSAFLIWVFSFELSNTSKSLLGNSVMVRLGESSFALYMLHLPVLRLFQRVSHGEPLGTGWWMLYVLVCLGLAHVVHTRVEVPSRNAIVAWFKHRQARRASQLA